MKITTIFTVIRYLQVAFVALPTALALINKIRSAFGSDKVQEALKAFNEFLDKICPPVPSADTTGTTPVIPEKEKRRRLFRFGNRLKVAGTITDIEAQEFCAQHNIQPVDNQWA
jgi:hypothetical protein